MALLRVIANRAFPRLIINNSALVQFANVHYTPTVIKNKAVKSGISNSTSLVKSFLGIMTNKLDNLINNPDRHFDYETLLLKRSEGALLVIDVRQPEELAATGMIPASVNIPLAEVDDALGLTPEAFRIKYGVDKPSKVALIVFSCQSGRRSVTALGKALSQGYLNAGNFKGGWLEWESHTRPLH